MALEYLKRQFLIKTSISNGWLRFNADLDIEEVQCNLVRFNKLLSGMIKLRHYEKATKFEKNILPVLTKRLFLLSSVKTSGRFFQIFIAFSENLDFKW